MPIADRPPPLNLDPALPAVESSDDEARGGWLGRSAAFLTSMIVHIALLITLALMSYPGIDPKKLLEDEMVIEMHLPSEAEDEGRPIAEDMYADIESQHMMTLAALSMAPSVGTDGIATGELITEIVPDADLLVDDHTGAATAIDFPVSEVPEISVLASGVPDGVLGDPRAVVRNYDQAFDRITEEILLMLEKKKVLVVWCFDQSESMKDDQQEIRARIDKVYDELDLNEETGQGALASAVTSYGQGFWRNTKGDPTADADELRAAIDSVKVDPSGKEYMCQAVLRSIEMYSGYAKQQDRQMALILVTDESGERGDNLEYLEPAIAAAKQNACRVYVLGREAVFGYPYAHMQWIHPQTGQEHWLPVDRGPETAFFEQLQTDGFRKRTDAHPSGFGSYEQSRLARETGGIFFMLPSLETRLVNGAKGDYDPAAMRNYRPDLRSRPEAFAELKENRLHMSLLQVVDDLDPTKKEVAEVMDVRFRFSAKAFNNEHITERRKAILYLDYLDKARKELDLLERLAEQEPSPRWQANYDLIYAQVLAYTARRHEYIARLDYFVNGLKEKENFVPMQKPGFMVLSALNVGKSGATVGGETTKSLIDGSKARFEKVIQEHPGTPWAARAKIELDRGFGFDITPQYVYNGPKKPRPPRTGGGGNSRPAPQRPQVTIPIPKL